jgi:hypothetical protein
MLKGLSLVWLLLSCSHVHFRLCVLVTGLCVVSVQKSRWWGGNIPLAGEQQRSHAMRTSRCDLKP